MIWINLVIIIILLFWVYVLVFHYKAPWVPIWQKDVYRLAGLLKLEDGKTFYELGCGNGRVIFNFAKKYPQVNFVGIELSPFFYLFCQLRKIFGGYKNVRIVFNDYLRLDFNRADYLYFFLNNKPAQEIGRKIEKEVNKKMIIISYCFEIFAWKNYLVSFDKPGQRINPIYVYQYQKRGD